MSTNDQDSDAKSSKLVPRAPSAFGIAVVALPVLGILLGGVYSVPAMLLTRGHPRLLTAILGLCLAATTVGLGWAFGTPWFWVLVQWPALAGWLLLLRHRSFGTLDGNLERFGLVHYAAIGVGLVVGTVHLIGVLPNMR